MRSCGILFLRCFPIPVISQVSPLKFQKRSQQRHRFAKTLKSGISIWTQTILIQWSDLLFIFSSLYDSFVSIFVFPKQRQFVLTLDIKENSIKSSEQLKRNLWWNTWFLLHCSFSCWCYWFSEIQKWTDFSPRLNDKNYTYKVVFLCPSYFSNEMLETFQISAWMTQMWFLINANEFQTSVNMGHRHDDTIEGPKVFVMTDAREEPLNKICFSSLFKQVARLGGENGFLTNKAVTTSFFFLSSLFL